MQTKPETVDMTIEMLTPEQVDSEWEALEPPLRASCRSNEVSSLDITPEDIRALAMAGLCVVFVGRENKLPKCVLVIQFTDVNGHKSAEVVAMGGSRLLAFKAAYWDLILGWLRANGCEFLDAYATERLARIYKSKFGFGKSCSFVRMVL